MFYGNTVGGVQRKILRLQIEIERSNQPAAFARDQLPIATVSSCDNTLHRVETN